MSRPMALGLILVVLFLTSQSDWKPPKEGQDEIEAKGGKGGRAPRRNQRKRWVQVFI